jgi:TatD DNase family protein
MMPPRLVDTHCHLDFERFDADRGAVVDRALDAGVEAIVIPALDLGNARKVIDLARSRLGLYAAVGVHPNSSADWDDAMVSALRSLAGSPEVVAIGEIGLDYYWNDSPPETQQRAFRAQLALAAELNLPVIVHNREATADVLRLLAESPLAGRERAGVLHSFSGDLDAAGEALGLGFHVGITGPVTYKKADELRAVAVAVPLDRLLIETDAPFLAPHPHRGQRNEPAHVLAVAERIAAERGLLTGELAVATTANAERLFGLGQRLTR